MPFTPFHLGPALLLGLIFRKKINLLAILISSVIIDVQGAYYLITRGYPYHASAHTFLGAILISFLLILIIYSSKGNLKKLTDFLKIKQDYSINSIIIGSLVGSFSHILLDSFLYQDIIPFWPIIYNPLLELVSSDLIYSFCILTSIFGIIIYLTNLYNNANPL